MKEDEFHLLGAPHGVALSVRGVLRHQWRGPTAGECMLVADSPPGGTDAIAIYALPSSVRAHATVSDAVARYQPPGIPPDARSGSLVIAGHVCPAWYASSPGMPPRWVGHVWVGIWPAAASSPGILLIRSRDMGPDDDALAYFQTCPVVQSIRVESEDPLVEHG